MWVQVVLNQIMVIVPLLFVTYWSSMVMILNLFNLWHTHYKNCFSFLSLFFFLFLFLLSNGSSSKMNGSLEHLDQPDPDSIKMFVGQIPRSWSETELKELFEPFGAVHQINILRDRTQNPPQSKGTVWVKGSLSGIICSTTLQAKFLLSDLDFNINDLAYNNFILIENIGLCIHPDYLKNLFCLFCHMWGVHQLLVGKTSIASSMLTAVCRYLRRALQSV